MNIEIGKIKNNKISFLNIEFELEIDNGTINTNVDYDSRILDKSKEKEFQEYVEKIVSELPKFAVKEKKDDNC